MEEFGVKTGASATNSMRRPLSSATHASLKSSGHILTLTVLCHCDLAAVFCSPRVRIGTRSLLSGTVITGGIRPGCQSDSVCRPVHVVKIDSSVR